MPPKQGLGLDEEPPPAATTKQPTQSGKQRPVRRPKGGSGHLATEDRNLVAEHDDLDRQLFVVVPGEAEQIKDSDECNVEKRQGHDPVSSSGPFNESPTQGARMTFSAPTGLGRRRECQRGAFVATDDGELQWRGRGQARLPRHVFAELLGMVRSGHSRTGSIA
jgi:hypothetical protein